MRASRESADDTSYEGTGLVHLRVRLIPRPWRIGIFRLLSHCLDENVLLVHFFHFDRKNDFNACQPSIYLIDVSGARDWKSRPAASLTVISRSV